MLRGEDGARPRSHARDQRSNERWEARAVRQMFGIEKDSGSDDSALADVISVFDEIDEEQSSTGDDPDYEEKAPYPLGTAGSADEDDVGEDDEVEDDTERDEEDEDDEVSEVRYVRSSNVHRSSHQTHDLRVKLMSSVWFYGFKTMFEWWEEFHECFDEFQTQTFQQFSKRTSTSASLRNKQIIRMATARKKAGKSARKAVSLVPKEWVTYSKTMVCTHGQPYELKGKGKRIHNKVRDTKCQARVNIRVSAKLSGSWHLRVNATGNHNHNLNKHIWDNYAENRTVKDPRLTDDVAVLHKAGANTQGILQYLRERTGKKTTRRDVHNMVQRYKLDEQAGLTDAQRAFAVMEEFCRQTGGNSAQVLVDSDTNVARIATFQSARMKRLFKAFPEIFKANNPDWAKIKVVMTDKTVHEKDVLREELPDARQLLCQWHVIT
ncbi:uncharacterized protein IUM83_05490 [Phytophthora cinnamomi]|uniref:uncharacterized protein n=1 Tax=Phytophthora cinnamomi TaxID=4785 RepID=UPI003559E9D7|nr:hypothetical protein IUM83_05490 [Phytophthora cinnamomi]